MPKRSPEGRSRFLTACSALLMAMLLQSAGLAQALPRDEEQPIHISADKALRDEKQGVTVYTGDVQMNQGSIYIEADELTIYHINQEADKIVAVGKPARMRQRPDPDKGPVHARALRIEYFRDEQRVHLQTEARIEQDGAIVAGDSIDYFIAEELVKADSDEAREDNRVQVVIPPSVQQDAGLAPSRTPSEQSAAEPAEPQTEATETPAGEDTTAETTPAQTDAADPASVEEPAEGAGSNATAAGEETAAEAEAEESASDAADRE